MIKYYETYKALSHWIAGRGGSDDLLTHMEAFPRHSVIESLWIRCWIHGPEGMSNRVAWRNAISFRVYVARVLQPPRVSTGKRRNWIPACWQWELWSAIFLLLSKTVEKELLIIIDIIIVEMNQGADSLDKKILYTKGRYALQCQHVIVLMVGVLLWTLFYSF